MAAGGNSFVKTQRIQGFTALLTSAACEWFLIFLLLINAMLSYLLTKFARYCGLQAPCIFCSRLDHVLGGETPEFYQNLLCSNHRSEISSLISCHIHSKVADGHGMCDDCLLSFTTKTKPKLKTHRLLVGKLGLFHGDCSFQSSLSRDMFTGSLGSRPCTCCSKLWKPEHHAHRSFQLKSCGGAILKSDIPLPHAPRQIHLNNCDNLKIKDKFSGSVTSYCLGKNSYDSLSLVGYTELKLTSDSEFEFPFSDDDDVASVIHENSEAGSDAMAQCTAIIPPKFILSDPNPAKPTSSSPSSMPSLLDPCVEPNISKCHDVKFLGSDSVYGYGLGEINQKQVNQKSSSSNLPELISLHEVSPSPDAVNISNEESEESEANSCLSQISLPAALYELMTLGGTHPFVGVSPEKSVDVSQASDNGIESIKKHEEGLKKNSARTGASIETDLTVNDLAYLSLSDTNSSNTNKSSVTVMEREVPGFVKEQPTAEEVDRVKEELKLSSSNNSSPRESNMSLVIPLTDVHYPEIQADASSSNGTQVLQKSVSVESGLESLDGSNVIEIEGESLVDRLKRQVEYDKKCISSLYKELEEERNASAIATNQALAMITKLQEEKAALHMEALQYLRMMEEQAEYDADALEKADDFLAEKEKLIQDLESELEFYRLNLTDEPMVESMHGESSHLKEENMTVQNVSVPHITNNTNISCNSKITVVSKGIDEAVAAETSSLELEEEKLYILQCLKNLEKKLHLISFNGTSSNMPSGRLDDGKSYQQGFSNGEGPQLDGQTKEADLSVQKKFNISNGSLTDHNVSVSSDSDACSLSKENNLYTSVGPKNYMHNREVDLVSLENEISDLNGRLEALKADHDLLERILKSLQIGNDIQFIQEIAHQLHELRKIGISSRW